MFRLVRTYGRFGRDYLKAWDDRWGTVCIGAPHLAMTFDTYEQAQEARYRAACALMGYGPFGWFIELA